MFYLFKALQIIYCSDCIYNNISNIYVNQIIKQQSSFYSKEIKQF